MEKATEKHIELTQKLIDEGKIIEAGWVGLRLIAIDEDASETQIDNMRSTFFAGAQHLFASMMNMLENDEEPTAKEISRMDSIAKELEQFLTDFKRRHNIS